MLALAINVLWFLVALLLLCGVVALVIWGIENFIMPLPGKLKQGIWFVVLLLAVIAVLTMLAGGHGAFSFR